MAKDTINLTNLDGRHGVASFTSDTVNESDMVTFDTEIYQGAVNQQVSVSHSPVPGEHAGGMDSKKEDHNFLYAQTASSTANRHPTVRTLSTDRPVMCSLDSLDDIPPSRNWHNRCLTILLVIVGILAIVSVIAAVVAYVTVLGDECTCGDSNITVTSSPITMNSNDSLQLLEQNAAQINTSSNNLSQIVDGLLTNLSNLNESVATLRGPEGERGPRGEYGFTGPPGLPGEQGDTGIPGVNGSIGPMGTNGVNATLRFSNINLTSSCMAVRMVEILTNSTATQNIPINNAFVENAVILERACMVTATTADAMAMIIPGPIFLPGSEQCSCTASLSGANTAQCILIRLECNATQITLTRT